MNASTNNPAKTRRPALSKTHEPICLKVPFKTSALGFEILTNWQKTQTPLYHSAFNLLLDQAILKGKIHLPDRRIQPKKITKSKVSLFKRLRKKKTQYKKFGKQAKKKNKVYPDSEIVLGALKRAEGLFESWSQNPNCKTPPIFGGKSNFKKRLTGLITTEEWKNIRNSGPLVLYGHAGGRDSQGGNKKISLDMEQHRLLFYPEPDLCIPLELKLKDNTPFANSLKELQAYCSTKTNRDLPVTYSFNLQTQQVSIIFPNVSNIAPFQRKGQTVQSILMEQSAEDLPSLATDLLPKDNEVRDSKSLVAASLQNATPGQLPPIPGRLLSYDANPYRKGFSVLQLLEDRSVKVIETFIWDNTSLKPPHKLASNHPATLQAQHKQQHEEREQAKLIAQMLQHYRCEAFAYEDLDIKSCSHHKGKTFNQATNNHWKRKEFLEPLLKRLPAINCKPVEINPAYSSQIGNANGRNYGIPDPACASLEIGRRALQDKPALNRFIFTFRQIFLAVYLAHLFQSFSTSSPKSNSCKKARHRQKEVSLAFLLSPERLSREFYRMRCEKLKQKTTPCTRRYFLRDLCSNLPLRMSIRLSSVKSSRSKVLKIQPTRVDALIIPPVAVPGLHPQ